MVQRPIDLRITGGPRGYLLRPVTQAGIRWAYLHFEEARWQGAAVLLDRIELQRVLCCCAVEDLHVMPGLSN
jgi:hypothetical protein